MLHTLEVDYKPQAAVVWLSRPDVRNALDPQMIAELTETFGELGSDPQVRAVVLAGRGIAFCSGSDAGWLKRIAQASQEERLADTAAGAAMLRAIHNCPKPTIARIQGVCMAAGMGLAAACDIAIASSQATFALPETRLGLVPEVIAPYVLRAMGHRHATRWFLTGETFSASEAWRIGFVHDLCEPDALDMRISALVDSFTLTEPEAVTSTKLLVHTI